MKPHTESWEQFLSKNLRPESGSECPAGSDCYQIWRKVCVPDSFGFDFPDLSTKICRGTPMEDGILILQPGIGLPSGTPMDEHK
jgi:hypothetical protein